MKTATLLFSLTLSAISTQALGAQTLPLTAKSWQTIDFNTNRTQKLSNSGGALVFDFPSAKSGLFADYLLFGFGNQVPLQGSTLSVTFAIATTGTPVFSGLSDPANTCPAPATTRAYFETAFSGEFDRWWANPTSYVLGPGTVTLTVPLTPDQWSSVYGKFGNYDANSLAGFQNTLQNTFNIGMSFGAACFFGHGVQVSGGTAQFQLLSYGIF